MPCWPWPNPWPAMTFLPFTYTLSRSSNKLSPCNVDKALTRFLLATVTMAPQRQFPVKQRWLRLPTPLSTITTKPLASHDVPAFYLHARSVVQLAKSLQCGQGADEIFAGYSYHGAAASIPRQAALATFADSFVDNNHQDLAGILNPQWLTHTDVS